MKRISTMTAALLALFAVAALFFAACGDDEDDSELTPAGGGSQATAAPTFPAGSTMAQIQQRGKLVIGVKYDVPLMGLLDPVSKKVDGFDVAIGKEVGKALGLREDQIEFVEAITANRIPYLQEDKVDLIISTMTINAERKQQIDFARPYYLAGQSILVRASDNSIRGVNDLNGKNVCSVQASTSERNVREKAPQANLTSLTTYSACVQAMKDGRVQAVSTDDIILSGFAAVDRELKLVGGQFTTEPYGIGIKKGKTDLVQFVDQQLTAMFADGRWDRLYDQYLGKVAGAVPAKEARERIPPTP